jgi:lysophospholipase L1-like esterase
VALFRILLLAAVIAGLSWFQFVNTASARDLGRDTADLFDSRPGRGILFVGNSRMFTNDLPSMVRAIADSADAPVKYQVRMRALPGLRFVDHANSKAVQALLAKRWDRVVFQAQSAEQLEEDSRADFTHYGRQLIRRARASGSPSSLVVNWTYSESIFREHRPWTRGMAHALIQRDHRALAREAGADLINVGGAFSRVEAALPDIALIPDGNHPSMQGTYVYALMVYAHLSGADVRSVRFAPDGVSEAEAKALREIVADYVASSIDA